MAIERKDLVQDTASSTGTGAFVMAGTPPTGFRPFSVHTVGATFDYKASAGADWEVGVGTWNGSNIARSPTASSNANGLVNFTVAPTVMEVVSAASVASFLRAADGVDVSTLTNVTSLNTGDSVLLLRSGTLYTALASLFGSTGTGGTAAATAVTLTVSAASTAVGSPVTVTVSTNSPLTGTQSESITLTAPVAGTWSTNPVTLNATTGTVTPTFTPSAAGSGNITASATGTPTLTGATVAYTSTAAVTPTLTVATPASPQTVGTSFPVTGTWTGTQPTSLDFLLTDSGVAGTWTQVAAGQNLVINANGTWTFNQNPASTATSRTITVRDHNATTVVSNQSGAYVVNAAAASTSYVTTLVSGANPGFPTATSMGYTSGDAAVDTKIIVVSIKAADNSVPDTSTMKWVTGKSATVAPMSYTDSSPAIGTNGNTAVHGNSVAGTGALAKTSAWVNVGDSGYGQFKNASSFYAWGTPGTWYVWVLCANGFKDVVRDAQGNPVQWVLS